MRAYFVETQEYALTPPKKSFGYLDLLKMIQIYMLKKKNKKELYTPSKVKNYTCADIDKKQLSENKGICNKFT